MRNHLREIATTGMNLVGDKPSARVLDIGCNDGTLLGYYPSAYDKYGVDPSDVAQEIGGGATVVQDIFPSAELTKRLGDKKCDVVTSIAMFYDLEDPIAFTRGIKAILAPEGVWILRNVVHADDVADELLRHHLPRTPRILQPRHHRIHPQGGRDEGVQRRHQRHQRRQPALLRDARRQFFIPQTGVRREHPADASG